jgi:hypothetical protein
MELVPFSSPLKESVHDFRLHWLRVSEGLMPKQEPAMTEVHAAPRPARRAVGITEPPALQGLDLQQLKKLRNTSQWLYVLGLIWGACGLVTAFLGARMIDSSGADASEGTWLMAYGLVTAVVGPYSAWARPDWGRVVCMLLFVPPLLGFPYGTGFSIVSLFALGAGWPLFGDDKVTDTELAAALRARGG